MNMATSLAKSIVKEFPARLLSSFYDGECCRVNPVILMYHSINDYLNHRLVVKPAILESQIKFLLDNDWEIVSMSQALSNACQVNENNIARQKKKVVLTFDDGYEDNYSVAFNILKKYNIPATIFLISDFVGTGKRFHWFQDGDNWAVSLNWDQINAMQDFGIEFGSHTKTHPLLSTVNSDEILFDEISGSRKELEGRLGEIKYFCYPAGDYNARAKSMVEKAGYIVQTVKGLLLAKPPEKIRLEDLFRMFMSGEKTLGTFYHTLQRGVERKTLKDILGEED